jgi:hypothetical protein
VNILLKTRRVTWLRTTNLRVAHQYLGEDFDVVFDDDDGSEAVNLVCLKVSEDGIRMVLVHCKFSGGSTPGERVKDVIEVSSQALRSARWVGKFAHLVQYLKARNEPAKRVSRPTRFLRGQATDLNLLVKLDRLRPIETEILIARLGLSKSKRTKPQSAVLAAGLAYVKENCSECALRIRFTGARWP